jgi:hypothetical protein
MLLSLRSSLSSRRGGYHLTTRVVSRVGTTSARRFGLLKTIWEDSPGEARFELSLAGRAEGKRGCDPPARHKCLDTERRPRADTGEEEEDQGTL